MRESLQRLTRCEFNSIIYQFVSGRGQLCIEIVNTYKLSSKVLCSSWTFYFTYNSYPQSVLKQWKAGYFIRYTSFIVSDATSITSNWTLYFRSRPVYQSGAESRNFPSESGKSTCYHMIINPNSAVSRNSALKNRGKILPLISMHFIGAIRCGIQRTRYYTLIGSDEVRLMK